MHPDTIRAAPQVPSHSVPPGVMGQPTHKHPSESEDPRLQISPKMCIHTQAPKFSLSTSASLLLEVGTAHSFLKGQAVQC